MPLFDNDPKGNAWSQQMDLMNRALAMIRDATPEWSAFLEAVKAMRDAQRFAEFGVAYSKRKRDAAERVVDNLIREIEECSKPAEFNLAQLDLSDPQPPKESD